MLQAVLALMFLSVEQVESYCLFWFVLGGIDEVMQSQMFKAPQISHFSVEMCPFVPEAY